MSFNYTDPVAKLLTYGNCLEMNLDHWDNYPEAVGLTAADIPELIRMATDSTLWELEGDRLEVWAPVHAWRSLGQLQAEAAIVPLTNLFDEQGSEWITEEIPLVYAMIGPAAIPTLVAHLIEPAYDPWARVTALSCLREIANAHSDHRGIIIAPLLQQLEAFEENPIELNTMLIGELIDLEVVEAAPVMERAFAAEQVDEFVVGNWPLVQIELGLKQPEDFSPNELKLKLPEEFAEVAKIMEALKTEPKNSKGFGTKSKEKSNKSKKKK